MIWNAASARDEPALRKWSGVTTHLRTFRGSICCKMRFVGSNAFFHSCFFTHCINQGGQTCSIEESFAGTKNTSEPRIQFVVSIQKWQRM